MAWDFLYDSQNYMDLLNSGTYLSLFTNWTSRRMNSVWIGTRINEWTEADFTIPFD